MLKVNGITKKFGELQALNNVSFEVGKGECLGIIGPNGAGKTTLFSVISGFLRPDKGDVRFKGISVVGKKPSYLAKMGLVRTFQLIKVFKNMSVGENLLVANSNNPDFEKEILKLIGLWDKKEMIAGNLSQGELRRLSIGMALATKPKVLLLDEPFSGLSVKEAENLSNIIKQLEKDGITQIIIEHKLKELFGVADRVLVLNFGRVIFEGFARDAVRDEKVIEAYFGQKHAKG
ncbi:ABC transporter ATP-binding protein [Archaeoglobales archaeon]|nr:MAG: ABC transporter ATP-binding protein [Archaeoglobales archaeon]